MQQHSSTQQCILNLAMAYAQPGSTPELLLNSNLLSAGIDSLGAVMLISDIEAELGLTFEQSEFGSISTLTELVRLVESKLERTGDA